MAGIVGITYKINFVNYQQISTIFSNSSTSWIWPLFLVIPGTFPTIE